MLAMHAIVFYSYDSAPSSLTTDSANPPTDLIATSLPDLTSTSDEETNPIQSTNTQSTPTHGLEGSDTTASPNPNDRETETTTTVTTMLSASQEALDFLPYAVGGPVGAIVVIIAIILTVVIVTLLVRRSREKSYKLEPNKDIGLLSYNNAMYDVGKETNICSAQKWRPHFPVCMARDHLLVLYMYMTL